MGGGTALATSGGTGPGRPPPPSAQPPRADAVLGEGGRQHPRIHGRRGVAARGPSADPGPLPGVRPEPKAGALAWAKSRSVPGPGRPESRRRERPGPRGRGVPSGEHCPRAPGPPRPDRHHSRRPSGHPGRTGSDKLRVQKAGAPGRGRRGLPGGGRRPLCAHVCTRVYSRTGRRPRAPLRLRHWAECRVAETGALLTQGDRPPPPAVHTQPLPPRPLRPVPVRPPGPRPRLGDPRPSKPPRLSLLLGKAIGGKRRGSAFPSAVSVPSPSARCWGSVSLPSQH